MSFRLAFWRETSLALLGARPWNLPILTRGQGASMLAAQVIDEVLVQLLSSVLFGLTLTQPLLRLRRPRPPLREIIRQSGLAVCLGMILATIIDVDIMWITGTDVISRFLPMLAFVVLWPLLGIYPWKAESSWVDRLGRAVGWGWIIVIGSEYVILQLA